MELRPFRSLLLLLLFLALLLGLFLFLGKPKHNAISWTINPSSQPSLVFQADVNRATAQQLTALPGIGTNIAQRILDYRQSVGFIYSISELKYVKGLYLAYDRLNAHLYVDTATVNELLSAEKAITPTTNIDLNAVDSLTLVNKFRLAPPFVKRFIRFRTVIGGFRSWATIYRVWGLTPRDSLRLHRYGFLSARLITEKPLVKFDLNTATETQLASLPHIGPVLAARVVKFRTALGFFAHAEQLYDVYGLDSFAVQELLPRLYVLPPNVRHMSQIDINQADWETLYAHPYLRNRAIARRIVNYRKKYGLYQSLEDLLQVYDFTPEMLNKLRPYLTVRADTSQ